MKRVMTVCLLVALLLLPLGTKATEPTPAGERALGRELLSELIAIDTTSEHGSTTVAADKLAQRFLKAGVAPADVQVVGDDAHRRNLVVRLRGRGEREPILLLAHLDVVEARREDWHVDPFALTERDGYFYGRGSMDIKGGAAGLVSALLRLHREGSVPKGDYILALTAGEEDGVSNGVQWLLAHRPELIHAMYAINVDGGGPEIRGGKPALLSVETAEKVYLSYTLTVHNPGGHSSLPTPDNAIYRLAQGLDRLSSLQFPLRSNSATRGYYGGLATLYAGRTADDMRAVAREPSDPTALQRLAASSVYNNAQLRSTCVPTLLQGGAAENALPQMARATINCRLLPDEDPDQVDAMLKKAVADPAIAIARVAAPQPSPPSPVDQALFAQIAQVANSLWGPIPVAPYMSAGASDSVFLRGVGMPSYVFNGIAYDVDDDRSHGQDERILVDSYYQSLDFSYRLLKAL
ncbi:M20/M25/M40 family metallo-hydrolase [Rhodanobacter glycinis]|uniref:M20/M25/M40 family metallo-hydrolase n=1 Tax=Rhodanobacter glycinis TaxID=582702 RepID=A0A502CEN8_9GAMM|nr:M20/M25/M40 family metallo-hydrolase [Rhodanobacter glycinis]TPG11094.1 M20/M25/M40 family metallo-hydrolase [Rhodanobacter glycinis]TPG48582.1 M20/M25/M40 family metallo-hydrolase [Rhodanobacter glycinis]